MKRIILIDPLEDTREVLVHRLNAQGYRVDACSDAAAGAELALQSPPAAVIADLWMPSISGVQLCRLLRAETATLEVPIILRGPEDDPKSHFWAERAGAAAYVRKGHMGALVRALARTAIGTPSKDDFFIQELTTSVDIRDRIAKHLDAALFDSVIAAEVRALAASGAIDRLFDLFSQLVSQLVRYRWLALVSESPNCFALHHHPQCRAQAEAEARRVLTMHSTAELLRVEDEDADGCADGPEPLVFEVPFAGAIVGHIGIAPLHTSSHDADSMLRLVARELGGPLRMAALVEEQQRLAAIDHLTLLFNRRSFSEALQAGLAKASRSDDCLSVLLLDVDHFKAINDTYGHAGGDQVLARLGDTLRRIVRAPGFAARWGGEEFAIAFPNFGRPEAQEIAELLRAEIEKLGVMFKHNPINVSASIGVATFNGTETPGQLMDRADRAMYGAKAAGRNQVLTDIARISLVPGSSARISTG